MIFGMNFAYICQCEQKKCHIKLQLWTWIPFHIQCNFTKFILSPLIWIQQMHVRKRYDFDTNIHVGTMHCKYVDIYVIIVVLDFYFLVSNKILIYYDLYSCET